MSLTLGQYAWPQKVVRLEELELEQVLLNLAGKQKRRRLAALVREFCLSPAVTGRSHDKTDGIMNTQHTEHLLANIWAELSAQSPNVMEIRRP